MSEFRVSTLRGRTRLCASVFALLALSAGVAAKTGAETGAESGAEILSASGEAGDAAILAAALAAVEPGVEIYQPALFAEFLPRTALDMVRRLPGFQLDEGDQGRGLSGAQGNLLINGRRPPPRGGSFRDRLNAIPVEDVLLFELIEAGARDLDMQGYPLLLNVITRSDAAGNIAGRLEVEPREDGGEEYQAEFTGSAARGRYELEGRVNLYEEDLVRYGNVRAATADNPFARLTEDQMAAQSRRDAQSTASIDLGGDRLVIFTATAARNENNSRPLPEAVAGGALLETNQWEQDRYGMSGEYRGPLSDRLDLTALLTRSTGDEANSNSLTENGIVSRSTSSRETGETASRASLRWRMSDSLSVETGATWAFNFLEGRSEAVIDGVVQDIEGSDARVEETRTAALTTVSWTPNSAITANFGGRVESFSLSSTNAGDNELTLTDIIPRADLSWALPRGWVMRASSEREVGQLNLDQFLAETNLDNALNTAGAATLEPQRDWTHRLELERRFGERDLLRFGLERREIDNPVSRVLNEAGDVVPANISPEWIERATLELELEADRFGWQGLLIEAEGELRRSERLDPLQGFVRQTSGHRDYYFEVGLRQEFFGGRYVLGGEIEHFAPATHYWLTWIRKDHHTIRARLDGEWRHSEDWRTGFWLDLPRKQKETRYVFDGVRSGDDQPVLVNQLEYDRGAFLSLWTEFEVREEAFLRLNVRSGRSSENTTLVEDPLGGFLDFARSDIDNVPTFNLRLRFQR